MEEAILKFIKYLHKTKKASANTEQSYKRDLDKFASYLEKELAVDSWGAVTATNLNSYMLYMEGQNYAASSISRSVASIRAFFGYLYKKNLIADNPSDELHPPKVEKKVPDILTVSEVEKLLAQPLRDTAKGMRDRAMLELLYATGIRVSELISLRVSDVNLKMGYINCRDRDRERAVPFGNAARTALAEYLENARDLFPEASENDVLYLLFGDSQHIGSPGTVFVSGDIRKKNAPQRSRPGRRVSGLYPAPVLQPQEKRAPGPGHINIPDPTQIYLNLNIGKMRDVYEKAHPRH